MPFSWPYYLGYPLAPENSLNLDIEPPVYNGGEFDWFVKTMQERLDDVWRK
jgi:hypothetical protein